MNSPAEVKQYPLPGIPGEYRQRLAEEIFPYLHDRIMGLDQSFSDGELPKGHTPEELNPRENVKYPFL